MKRSTIAMTALLALCAAALAGCTAYEFQYFRLEKGDVEKQADGTWVHVSILTSRYVDEEEKLIRERNPYKIHFAIWGHFEKLEKLDAWFILNGKKVPFAIDLAAINSDRVTSTGGDMFIFPSEPDHIMKTPWEEIETLALRMRFTATVDGATRNYNIVIPLEKTYEERKGNPVWDAMMSV